MGKVAKGVSRESIKAFRLLIYQCELRQIDVAWLCGVNPRQVRAWATGEYPVPQYATLLLKGYRDGLLSPKWLVGQIGDPPPQ